MEKIISNRKGLFAILTLFAFVFAFQMAEPASAASWKKFDKGSKTVYGQYGYVTYSWAAYKKNKNYVMVKGKYYWYSSGTTTKETGFLKKVSKSKLKYTVIYKKKSVHYVKTRLSAVNYFKKYVKPTIVN